MKALLARVDEILIPLLQRWSMPALRFSIAVVFIWFGTLKVLGLSPVVELVGATVYWVDPAWFVPFLGVVEVLLGIGLALGRALRMVLLVLVLQTIGTAGAYLSSFARAARAAQKPLIPCTPAPGGVDAEQR